MSKDVWRAGRRAAARTAIVDAAWRLVAESGLAGLSIRDLAAEAGITTPTVYAYFTSKHAVYDAMFAQAAAQFAALLRQPFAGEEADQVLLEALERFADFCVSDVTRYQLLFQRTIPGFEPSPASYAFAVEALDTFREGLGRCGIDDPRLVDLWTALSTGMVDQQISNDPGGDRWTRLGPELVEMFLAHVRSQGRLRSTSRRKGTR